MEESWEGKKRLISKTIRSQIKSRFIDPHNPLWIHLVTFRQEKVVFGTPTQQVLPRRESSVPERARLRPVPAAVRAQRGVQEQQFTSRVRAGFRNGLKTTGTTGWRRSALMRRRLGGQRRRGWRPPLQGHDPRGQTRLCCGPGPGGAASVLPTAPMQVGCLCAPFT